jgi:hypothetical protein
LRGAEHGEKHPHNVLVRLNHDHQRRSLSKRKEEWKFKTEVDRLTAVRSFMIGIKRPPVVEVKKSTPCAR